VIRDVYAERSEEEASALAAADIQALIHCSLVRGGCCRAMMAVHHSRPRNWSADEIELVRSFVERCWAMIEQRASEAKLKSSEALLRIAGKAARLGGFSIELPEVRVTWSEEVCAIYEVAPGTVPTMEQAEQTFAPEFRELVKSKVAACAETGTPFDLEVQSITAKGRRVWLRIIGHPEFDGDGQVARVHGALQDISERRRLEDQLRQAQKMEAVGQLAGGIAHDFNNILSVIIGYAHFIARDLNPRDPLLEEVEEIRKAGERASELTRQLLAFSRKQVLLPRVVDLNQIALGLERMLQRLVGEDIDLTLRTAEQLGRVLVDPGQVEQVIMNLVVNARDAILAGGTIVIETANVELADVQAANQHELAVGRHVMLAVSDTGAGMDGSTRAHIFEPFFTTKEQGKGTGLGLSTVYGIVTQSGGHIAVQSEVGAGTTFKLYFPRVDEALTVTAHDASTPETLSGNETVLLVEDDEQVLGMVRATLARSGYNVLIAQNAGEAMLVCEQHAGTIHLLLTDVMMPRMSGRQLSERLRPLRIDMRVLYMSGYMDAAIRRHGLVADGIDFLAKPITPNALLRKVRELLDTPRRTDPPR
jgi:PAS domain S-box-containing protein